MRRVETAAAPPVARALAGTGGSTRWCSRSRPSCIRLPGVLRRRSRWCSTTACSRRRRCAMRNGELAVPRHLLEPGAGVPAAGVGRRPLGFRTLDAPRLLAVAAGVLLTIAVYSCARRVTTSRGNALLAAGLVTTSGSVLWVTGAGERRRPVARAVGARGRVRVARTRDATRAADAVWVGLAAGARGVDQGAVGAGHRDRRADRAALALRAAAGRARRGRRRRDRGGRVRGGRAAVRASTDVWDQSYTYHQRLPARRTPCPRRASARSSTRCGSATCSCWSRSRSPLIMFVVRSRSLARRRAGRATATGALASWSALLVLWAVLVFALLVWEPAMWRAHVAQLVPPLALLASAAAAAVDGAGGRGGGDRRPFWVVQQRRRSSGPTGTAAPRPRSCSACERCRVDALVISDDPGLAWRAGHDPPGDFADTVVPAHRRRDSITAARRW